MRHSALFGFIAVVLTTISVAWAQDQEPQTDELPPPPAGLEIFQGKPSAHPFEALPGQAAAERVLFEGAGPDNTEIIIREMLIGPGADVRLEAVPGPALIDPRSGVGTLRAGERSEQLQIASAISVAPGVPIELSNDGDDSLLVRLYIVETR